MANLSPDARHPAAPPEPPDLPGWLKDTVLWAVHEVSRRTQSPMTSPWLSAEEAAAYTRIPYNTFRKLAKDVPRHRYSEQGWVYHRNELDTWLNADANRYWEDA